MGKSRRNNNHSTAQTRSHYPIASRRLYAPDPFLDVRPVSKSRRPSPSAWSTPDIQSDARLWRPETDSYPLTYSGTQARSTRLYDAPRPPAATRVFASGPTKTQVTKRARAARAQLNRFGPNVDHQTRAILAFDSPQTVPVCDKRRTRREVLMAHGRGGSRVKPPRFNELSHTTCR